MTNKKQPNNQTANEDENPKSAGRPSIYDGYPKNKRITHHVEAPPRQKKPQPLCTGHYCTPMRHEARAEVPKNGDMCIKCYNYDLGLPPTVAQSYRTVEPSSNMALSV